MNISEKSKIALFITSIGYGGAEKVVSLLLDELTKYYDVTLILFYNEIKLPINKDAKVIILSKPGETFKNNIFARIFDTLKFAYKYPRVLKKEKIEVAISLLVRQNIINGLAKMNNPKLKTIISERCFPSIMYKNGGKLTAILTRLLIPYFYNKNNKLFSNSIYINDDLITNYNVKIDTSVIYNPILINDEKPASNSYNYKEPFQIVTVGRLIPVKNQKSIVESLSMLSGNAHLHLYGEGALLNDLKTQSINLNIDEKITFHGNVKNVKSHIVKSHCFVLSSLTEGFPNVVLEAMSVGLPVICTNCMSGPLELLNENEKADIPIEYFFKAKYGILVNVDDALGLSKAIDFLQNNSDVRNQYSELSYERAKDYEVSKIGIQVKNLIDTLL